MSEGGGDTLRGRAQSPENSQWVHRQALQIIGLLPDDMREALAVIDRARLLLEMWKVVPEPRPEASVVPLRPVLAG